MPWGEEFPKASNLLSVLPERHAAINLAYAVGNFLESHTTGDMEKMVEALEQYRRVRDDG